MKERWGARERKSHPADEGGGNCLPKEKWAQRKVRDVSSFNRRLWEKWKDGSIFARNES